MGSDARDLEGEMVRNEEIIFRLLLFFNELEASSSGEEGL